MNGSIRFVGHPDIVECVQWSADAEIALAFGDHVEILSPRYPLPHSGDKEGEISRWHVARLTTNTFANDDVPLVQPQPTRNFFLGVEQSLSHVTSLAWSGPGLAEHKRCALAVLTSNNVLSVWASGGSTSDNGNWERVLIVNHCFEKASSSSHKVEPHGISNDYKALFVKAFAWSSPKALLAVNDMTGREVPKTDVHYIAVMNGMGDVAVVQVISPFMNSASSEKQWTTAIVCHVNSASHIGQATKSFIDSHPIYPYTYGGVSPVRDLHWSPWIFSNFSHTTRSYCILATLQSERVHFQVMFDNDKPKNGDPCIDVDSSHFYGQQKFGLGWVLIDGNLCFIAVGSSSTVYFKVKMDDSDHTRLRVVRESLLSLDNCWSKRSGVAQSPSGSVIYIASHATLPALDDRAISSVPVTGQDSHIPEWQNRLHCAINAYDREHSTNGQVELKIWGLATSPCGDYVACLFTLHPSSMIQYEQYAKSWSTLDIACQGSTLSDVNDGNTKDPRHDPLSTFDQATSLEGLFFSAVRSIRKAARDGEPAVRILNALNDHLKSSVLLRFGPAIPPQSSWVAKFQALFYGSDTFVSSVLYELQCSSGLAVASESSRRRDVAKAIAIALIEVIPECHFSSHVDLSILSAFSYVAHGHSKSQAGINAPVYNETFENVRGLTEALVEQCCICENEIILHGTDTAECSLGHTFARCSMSFLSIQEPGITKCCRICKAPYLRFNGFRDTHAPEGEPVLARLLEHALYMCVFCGGKFES